MLEYAERQGWRELTAEEQMSAKASRQKASCIGQGSESGEEAQLFPPQCIKRCRQKRHMNPFKVYAKIDSDEEKLVLVPQVDLDHIKVAKKEKASPA